jgi:predicted NBD/HSP70 family sugar kinase
VFDVGGTHVRAAIYHATSRSVDRIMSSATPNVWTMPEATREAIRDRLLEEMWRLGKEVLLGQSPGIVSVAFAGPVDARGRVLAAPTMWGPTSGRPMDLISCLKRL